MPATTRFCQLCASEEGFGRPGVIPTTHNNPMDLRHSPHSSHAGEGANDIGEIDTVADGWADAERQARIWANEGLTLQQAIETRLAPPNENNSDAYLAYVLNGFHGAVYVDTPMTEVLKIPAEYPPAIQS